MKEVNLIINDNRTITGFLVHEDNDKALILAQDRIVIAAIRDNSTKTKQLYFFKKIVIDLLTINWD